MKSVWPRLVLALPLAAIAAVGAVETSPPQAARDGLLVVSPRSFEPALKEFVGWKQSQRSTTWVALEEILADAPGADAPERLKRWLYRSWRDRGTGYVLLAGDVDVLPVRYMVLDRKTPAAFNYSFYPSDLYYADLGQLTNATSIPVMISAGCSTAHFAPLPPYEPYLDLNGKFHPGTDHGEQFTEPPLPPAPLQVGTVNPDCLGEALLKRADTGAVAYIGCNTGSQPFGLTLVDGFVRELVVASVPRLGDCWNSALRYYMAQQKLGELKPTESWVPPSIFFQGMKFMVFGDPSLRLPGPLAALPVERDLRPALRQLGITPRPQGGRGTCSVFAVTTALEFAIAQREKPAGRLSVEYLNWASNEVIGQQVDGGFFADLWRGFASWGICREEEMPYAPDFKPAARPAAAVVARAKQQAADRLRMTWIKPWDVTTGLTELQLVAIRQALASGWPVCSGLRWPKRQEWQNEVLQMCPPGEVFDGHSVLLTGYRKDAAQPGGGTFTFYNSNRPDSECRMTWEYARAYMNDAMWIEPMPLP